MGGLSEKRMLMFAPCGRNIRRIGSLQSPNRAPVEEVIGIAARIGGGLLRSGRNSQAGETSGSGGSSKHHKLGVVLMTEPMMLSPSSFPHTSNKMLGGAKKEHIKVCTSKNNGFLRDPDVDKNPFHFSGFKKHPTRQARVINENTDRLLPKGPDWVNSELTHVFLCRCRELFVEMRIIFEGQTSFTLETAEIPHNFIRI